MTIAGLLLLGLGHGAWALFFAMGLLGVPHGLTFPLALALVADATPVTALPRANATLLGSTNITAVIVPLILGGLIPAIGYQDMTLVMLGPVLAFSAVHLALRKGQRLEAAIGRDRTPSPRSRQRDKNRPCTDLDSDDPSGHGDEGRSPGGTGCSSTRRPAAASARRPPQRGDGHPP